MTLAAIKAEPKLKDMALVKYSRLSVQPVTRDEWKLVCKMGGLKAYSMRSRESGAPGRCGDRAIRTTRSCRYPDGVA